MPQIAVKDANGQTVNVARVPDTGQATAANSLPMVLASDQGPLPLSTGAATAAAQATGNASLASIDTKLPAPVGGAMPVAGPVTDAELRAAPVPVSVAGVATAAAQATGNTSLASIDGKLTGVATAAAQATGNTSLANLDADIGAPADAAAATDTGSFSVIALIKRGLTNWTTLLARLPTLVSGRIPVDGSGVTQPVSGTVNVNGTVPVSGPLTDTQLRAAAVPVSAASLPLPTGAATSAAQTTGNTSLASIDAKTPALSGGAVPVTASALPLPTGAATAAAQTTGNTSLANIDGKLPAQVAGRVPVQSSVPAASSVVILAAQTAATGTNWTAFGTQACVALDIVNNTATTIEYRRGATGVAMQIPAGAARMVIGITNANQIDVRRTDTANTQVTVQAEAIVA